MTTFDERERAFEAKFVHDADLQFRANARCNRLLGEWAAELLGKSGEEAHSYAMSLVGSDYSDHGQEVIYRKLISDLKDRADETTIRKKMAEMTIEAKMQVLGEKG